MAKKLLSHKTKNPRSDSCRLQLQSRPRSLGARVGDSKLGSKARLLIEDAANEKFVSAASLWEIAVKHSLGKLDLSDDFEVLFPKQLEINGFEMLPIKTTHLLKLIFCLFITATRLTD